MREWGSVLLQDLRDTSQYVSGEVVALEHEQNQIDKRAAELEAALRNVMDTGSSALNSPVVDWAC